MHNQLPFVRGGVAFSNKGSPCLEKLFTSINKRNFILT